MGSNLLVNPDTHVIMHHKYFVSDAFSNSDPLVWTGSHNWSTNANTRNDENTIVVHDAEIAQVYYWAFHSLINPETEDTTSIWDFNSKAELQIFPTLAKIGDPIYLKANKSGIANVQLFDLSGKMLDEIQTSFTSNQPISIQFERINSPGFYFVRIGNNFKIIREIDYFI
jgi:phosphatidylserine/phosphatidylglycerophosphate/cardiolipin synthase-like enzyme